MKERLDASERINEKLMTVLQKSDQKKPNDLYNKLEENKAEIDVMLQLSASIKQAVIIHGQSSFNSCKSKTD